MDLLVPFGESQGQYIFPREMPEIVEAMEEIMKKRPIISYRIFLNNIDTFIPQELAKAFVNEKFVEREIPPKHETSSSSSSEDDKKSKRAKSVKRDKSGRRQSASKGRRASQGRRQSKRQSTSRRQSKRKSSARRQSKRKSSTRRQSQKKRKSSTRRQSKRKSSTRRGSRRQSATRRKSTKGRRQTRGSGKEKKKHPLGTKQPVMSKNRIAKYFQELWPVHVLHRPKCHKRYDWLVDYSHLEEKRLTALQIQGFDPEKAKAKRNCNYVFSEELKSCLRKKFWYYTRYMPEPPTPAIQAEVKTEEEQLAPRKTAVETIVNQRIWDFMEENIERKPIDFYKKDIETVEPKYEIYGTLSSKYKNHIDKLSPDIKQVVKYISENPTNPKEFNDHIFTCTTFIFDISREDSEAEIDVAKTILDMLISTLSSMDEMYRTKMQSYFGIHTYFLISPLLTWGESRDLGRLAVDYVVREEFFPKRIPHPRYKKHYDFENYVHDKAYQYRDIMRILIIGVGLVYGPGGHLDRYIDLARGNKSFLPLFGPGKNLINCFHTEELARLIIHLLANFPYFTPYIVASEKKPVTQKQIVEVMSHCVAENYIKVVPYCFNKTFGISQNALDVMTSECNVFPSYLHDAAGWVHNKAYVHDACTALVEYIEKGTTKPLRIIFFGPFSLDQTRIALEVQQKYGIIYLNPSKAVYILLKLILRMQDIMLALSEAKKTVDDKFRFALGKTKMNKFNVVRSLAWQREFRRFLLRNKSVLPIRRKNDKIFTIKLHEYLSDSKAHDDKTVSPEALLTNAKTVLSKYEKVVKASPGTLIPARLEVVSEIIHEILQHPIVKFTGYILDGAPATELEAEIIFTRTQGLGGSDDKKDVQGKEKKKDEKEKPEKEKKLEESKFTGHYERLPMFVFHTAKKTSACLKDCVAKQAKSFQKEYMDKFQHLEFYRHNVGKIKSTMDFFTTHTSILPITFDTSRESIQEILDHIYELIGDPKNYAGKWDPNAAVENSYDASPSRMLQTRNDTPTPSSDDIIRSSISKEETEEDEAYSRDVFNEMKELADRCLPYGYFLNRFLYNNLIDALISTANENPENPIDYFAEYLFRNNTEGRMPRDKILPPPERENLDRYPFNVPKRDLQFSTHL